jgi:hypothetical protein
MDDALTFLKEAIILMFIVFGMLCLMALCFWMYPTMTDMKQMDCALVEYSPDVALEIKQACRDVKSRT